MISVIIPCYNSEKTLRRCLEPLLKGAFTDFEIILADDGSTDGIADVCRQLEDSRIHLLLAEKNEGVSHARNRGLEAAQGDYVAFVDADDSLDANYLQILADAAQSADCDWVASPFSFVEEDNPNQEVLSLPPALPGNSFYTLPHLRQVLPGLIFFNKSKSTLASVCGCLYRRSLLESHHIRFRSGLRYGEDTLFNLEFSTFCQSFSYISQKLYRYHQHEGESTDIMFRRYRIQDFALLIKEIETWRCKTGSRLSPEESNYVLTQTFAFINHNALLKSKDEARLFFRDMDACYWNDKSIRTLWESISIQDIQGKLAKLRFRLIKNKHWHMLAGLQKSVRLLKQRS